MEKPSPSERASTLGSDNGQQALCDGIGMDGQWQYQLVYQSTRGCEPVRACKFSALTADLIHVECCLIPSAQRRYSGIGVYAQRGISARRSKGGKSFNTNFTLLFPHYLSHRPTS